MTQEEKQLLLKDLCARFLYGVIVGTEDGDEFLIGIEYGESFLDKDTVDKTSQFTTEKFGGRRFVRDIEEIKPYLRPMLSMTEEEKEKFLEEIHKDFLLAKEYVIKHYDITKSTSGFNKQDWLNANHFDYRGLIEKGLALEAPEGMYEAQD